MSPKRRARHLIINMYFIFIISEIAEVTEIRKELEYSHDQYNCNAKLLTEDLYIFTVYSEDLYVSNNKSYWNLLK